MQCVWAVVLRLGLSSDRLTALLPSVFWRDRLQTAIASALESGMYASVLCDYSAWVSCLQTTTVLESFRAFVASECLFGQVWIGLCDGVYALRHVEDRGVESVRLKALDVSGLREWALVDATGSFRPLKSAPTLRGGWCCQVHGVQGLWAALENLYPGSIGDWYAVEVQGDRGSGLRSYLDRQTGMYRNVKLLDDSTVGELVQSCCDAHVCLKRRVWEAGALGADSSADKSAIPCLEPCAVLLEGARREAKAMGFDKLPLLLGRAEIETLEAALRKASEDDPARAGQRVGDLSEPLNPRRILLALNRLRRQLPQETTASNLSKG